jgi:hypothetical protein
VGPFGDSTSSRMVARMEPPLLSVGAKTVQLPPLRES